MTELTARDIPYEHRGTRMTGYFCAPKGGQTGLPGLVLVHDAFGLGEPMIRLAHRYAHLGFAVLAADVWGERKVPGSGEEIGPLIGGMVADREEWLGRIDSAHAALVAQPEVAGPETAIAGYCFGGASALEYVRVGGPVRAAVSVHGGLDLLAPDWHEATRSAQVLVCTGSADPMATAALRDALTTAMTDAGITWELDLYSGAQHGFTNPLSDLPGMPPGVAYDERASERAWAATESFLRDVFAAG
ncbi:dienelactone hydrolase family protein [Gryllotalpicola ginsengisoli]|uniref:dienelactone hydrolase family protein n=1 Tax=Gryllotalpicola ginsengisoli TaxID=444608 RepID=UPI0003B433B8|nr:dienelactone hydrolase family protein [Gryllotalpicola ginsengisoli]